MNKGEIGHLLLVVMPGIMAIEEQVYPRHTLEDFLWNFNVSCSFL